MQSDEKLNIEQNNNPNNLTKPTNQNEDQEILLPKTNNPDTPPATQDPAEESTSDLIYKSIYEFIGTFMFTLAIYFCDGDVAKFALGFYVILCLFGGFSGAHVNPAITFGFYLYDFNLIKGIPKLFFYSFAQFLGAFASVQFSKAILQDGVYGGVPADATKWEIAYIECFFTGTFMFVILFCTTKHTSPTPYAPLNCAVIAVWFYWIVKIGSALGAAGYNPAILMMLNCFAKKEVPGREIRNLKISIAAEYAGVFVFAIAFLLFFERYTIGKKEKQQQAAEAKKLE